MGFENLKVLATRFRVELPGFAPSLLTMEWCLVSQTTQVAADDMAGQASVAVERRPAAVRLAAGAWLWLRRGLVANVVRARIATASSFPFLFFEKDGVWPPPTSPIRNLSGFPRAYPGPAATKRKVRQLVIETRSFPWKGKMLCVHFGCTTTLLAPEEPSLSKTSAIITHILCVDSHALIETSPPSPPPL